jgi:hypothetical protein
MAPRPGAYGIVLAILLCSASAGAATLSADSAGVTPGLTGVRIAVTLAPDTADLVAAIQFDLAFDPRVAGLADIQPGDAAANAGKSVSANQLAPGRHRVIIAGLNQNVMGAGEVAVLFLDIAAAPPNGEHPLRLEDLVMANPTGRAVPASAEWGTIRVTGGVPVSPAPCCGCAGLRTDGGAASGSAVVLLLAVLAAYGAGRSFRASSACSRAWTSRVRNRFAGVGTPCASP